MIFFKIYDCWQSIRNYWPIILSYHDSTSNTVSLRDLRFPPSRSLKQLHEAPPSFCKLEAFRCIWLNVYIKMFWTSVRTLFSNDVIDDVIYTIRGCDPLGAYHFNYIKIMNARGRSTISNAVLVRYCGTFIEKLWCKFVWPFTGSWILSSMGIGESFSSWSRGYRIER